ncbi:MAG: MFS transporter [Pseudomonadota bacterium]|nr:MFS transporter [Pseudomonadota bacterium]
MKPVQNGTIAVILVGHFTAAFAALGMSPFFTLILEQSLHSEAIYLAGWLYGVPILFMALSSPLWGYLADKVGKRAMLMRAQLGLAASFLLAGFADSTAQFFVALVLQGVLGGTFGASNAYLASVLRGRALTRSLTLMQGSARAALVCAPVVLGLFVGMTSPIELYCYLALLPLLSALLIFCLPPLESPSAPEKIAEAIAQQQAVKPVLTATQINLTQFLFVFATVITFPYFIPFALQDHFGLSASIAGLLFGLPHLVYLLCAAPLSRWFGEQHLLTTLVFSLLLLSIALFAQAQVSSINVLIAWRVVMGIAMTLVFIALHGAIAAVVHSGNAGRTMGWFESSSKWGGVAAAVVAGVAAQMSGLTSPFLVGAACTVFALCYLTVLNISLRRLAAVDS